VRYEAVNAMLLNEFLKAHRKLEEEAHKDQVEEAVINQLRSTNTRQQKEIEILTVDLKEQASQIRKVSEQLELSKTATVAGNP
jgi:hypothetical protein